MGEVYVNENPALKELKGPTLLPVALYNPKLSDANYGSVFYVDMPQNRYTLLLPRSVIAILLTDSATAWYPFSLTIPDIKST